LVARAGATPLVIGAARMVVGAAVLLALARAAAPLRIDRADRWRCLALGVCMAGYQAAYFSAVTMTGIATAALIAICSAPLLAGPDAARQIALGWPWFLYLGAVTTAAAYSIYTIGLRDVPASVAGIVSLLEPLTATLLGVALFGERLGAAGAAGAVLLFAGLGVLLSRESA